jgi:hypothetical protein
MSCQRILYSAFFALSAVAFLPDNNVNAQGGLLGFYVREANPSGMVITDIIPGTSAERLYEQGCSATITIPH